MLVATQITWEQRGSRRTAQSDVDKTVSAADAALYPNRKRREEDGDDAEEDIAAAHLDFVRFWIVPSCRGSEEVSRDLIRNVESRCLRKVAERLVESASTSHASAQSSKSEAARAPCIIDKPANVQPFELYQYLVYRQNRR